MAIFKSSTRDIPESAQVPRHVAIIMDGNGRWAKKRFLPRFAGHKRGVETVREAVKNCLARGVQYLTLFAFSSENWRRPEEEVSLLMQLFVHALQQEVTKLHRNGVRLRVVGDLSRFDAKLQSLIVESEQKTAENTQLTLTIAANYGGRWDILQAVNRMVAEHPERPLLLHAVQQILHPPVVLDAWPDADRRSRLVLIVKDIEEAVVQRLWDAFLGQARSGAGAQAATG